MMSAVVSILLRSLVDEDVPIEALDVGEAYLLLLPLVPLTIVVNAAPLLLLPVSPYDDDKTDLQRTFDVRISRSYRVFAGLTANGFALLHRNCRCAMRIKTRICFGIW